MSKIYKIKVFLICTGKKRKDFLLSLKINASHSPGEWDFFLCFSFRSFTKFVFDKHGKQHTELKTW